MSAPVGSLLFIAWAAAVALCDCRNRRVPNLLVAAGLATACVCAFAQRSPFDVTPLRMMEGAAVGLVALLPFYMARMMGAADVKVFAVLGAWCGVHALLGLWVAASLAAGIHAAVLLIATRTPLAALSVPGRRSGTPTLVLGTRRATPYAACLTVPAIVWTCMLAWHVVRTAHGLGGLWR
ncbi:A24 family peptidase [Paraburkholderia phosphatilytica]|uniref:A24 family peptidase n=1 Tax=Paraburkholderia phosphatilytica TaxID=2282883 RepID=UPI000E4C9F93|nr:prepilin peptidase [Paraburkholderia phosphatilytica]